MLNRLGPVSVDSLNAQRIVLDLAFVRLGSQLDHHVQGNFQIRQLFVTLVQEISKDGSENSLVSDDEDVVLTFQFHDDWFEAKNQVRVGFTCRVSVMKLVLVSGSKVSGIMLLQNKTYQTIEVIQQSLRR